MFITVKMPIRLSAYWNGIVLFFVSVLTSHAFSQDYNSRNFTSTDGLAQSYVYSVVQDERGYLWAGTGSGLSRFNGYIFKNFNTSDSLADNFIACSISDGNNMWFGHMNGSLSFYNGRSFQVVHTPLSDLGPVTCFAKSQDGRIWAGKYGGGLLKLSKGGDVLQHYSGKDIKSIISFIFIGDSELLIGTNTGLLYCRLKESGEIEIIHTISEIPESKVVCILKMKSGRGYYAATENEGVYELIFENNLFKISKLSSEVGLDFTGIQTICEDSRSDLWLGSFGKGLIKIDFSITGGKTKISVFNKSNGFATDNVKTIFEDCEGNMWSGNFGEGLTQITAKIFCVYNFDKALYGKNVFSVYTDRQYCWIGTEKGLLKLEPNTGKIVRFYGKSNRLPEDIVTALYSADGKELWIGTEQNGVFRLDTEHEKIRRYPIGDGKLENSIASITGQGELIWIGTKKGICSIHSVTNAIKWYSISQGGLPHNNIHCLYADKTGRLWISSHSNTLAYIRNEKVYKFPINTGKEILMFGPITEDANSHIWVGSYGDGIYKLASDSVSHFTTEEGLLTNFCYSIICDDNNNLWIGHKGGLSKIRTIDSFVKPIQQFEHKNDNLQFNPNAGYKDQQGRLWFGSEEGLLSFDPAMEISRFQPPVPEIISIKINDEEIDFSNKILLNPGKYKIQIDFLAVNLKEPALVTYQLKLEGYDQWSEVTKNTHVTYNNLTDGKYTFILNASSGDGVVSTSPVTISIIIRKSVWKQWWFYLLIFLILILLVFYYVKIRELRYRDEKRILEEKVQERTHEIQNQKDEIELQRDLIRTKNNEILSSIRYARYIQQAVLPSLELLDNLLPENFLFLKPKDIVSGDFYWLTEKDNKIIFTIGDCTGHGVPGAFMSLLSITMLNEIVNIQGITRPDEIVNRLHSMINQSLRKSRMDGLDLALCVLDRQKGRIQFTGAMNHMVYISDGKLEVVKANQFSVNSVREDFSPFTLKEFYLKKGDIIYLFSDGYLDQFGGENDKKYSVRRFYSTLLEIHNLPVKNQKVLLEEKLSEWMKNSIQTDDITVMGIRY
jgi:ligand-binding sensor domain-containing protein/serine phosphatase RsbU (regulator of sigma subunit)